MLLHRSFFFPGFHIILLCKALKCPLVITAGHLGVGEHGLAHGHLAVLSHFVHTFPALRARLSSLPRTFCLSPLQADRPLRVSADWSPFLLIWGCIFLCVYVVLILIIVFIGCQSCGVGARYFCISINILDLYSEMLFSDFEQFDPFKDCVQCVRWAQPSG